MSEPLTPGRLSQGLPQLKVSGNKIVDSQTLQPVSLRGVNRSGLEYSSPHGAGSLAKAQISEAELDAIIEDWNANVIRVPFNQEWALERDDYDPKPYRCALEAVIEMAARRGAYTILDLQWLDAHTPRGTAKGKPNYVSPLPNLESIELWRQLARLWRNETAILYDVFNEPHDPLPDDAEPLIGIRDDSSVFTMRIRSVGPAEWHPWARQLVNAIRSQNPDALIFVPGVNWGYDLKGCPIRDLSDVVYSTHVYPSKGRDWDSAFGDLSDSVPVFAGEWGGRDGDLKWGSRLAAYFDDHDIGWTAWSWSDEPPLVTYPPTPPYKPTKFGALVRSLLTDGSS